MFKYLQNIHFVEPYWLFLLLIPMWLAWRFWKNRTRQWPALQLHLSGQIPASTWRTLVKSNLFYLRLLACSLFILALARPQKTLREEEVKAEGIDIFLVIDLSSSMLAQDFKPDRLEVSKKVAAEFVDNRPYDRLGLAVFSGEAFTQCPLTTDHLVLKDFLGGLQCGFLEDGTAIGMGLATAVNRIKDSESKSKVIILLTDGVNNAGYIQPLTAAQIAREFEVKVYTIGVGSNGEALTPVRKRPDGQFVFRPAKVEIDEDLLIQIADMTGGRYFRATSEEALFRIYDEIDRLEKTEIEITVFKRYSDEYHYFLALGLLLIGLELLFGKLLIKSTV